MKSSAKIMAKKKLASSYEETQKFAEEFSKNLLPGDLVLLYGDLGAGKTTFVQGIAKGLEIERRIVSPTFIIVRKYEAKVAKDFYHIDLYRTGSEKDLESIGLQEILNDKESIVAIEWPEKLGKYLPEKRWEIRFENLDGDKREITIQMF